MRGEIFSFLQNLCPLGRNTAAGPDECSALLPKDEDGAEEFSDTGRFQATSRNLQYSTDNGGDEEETSQPGTPNEQLLWPPFHRRPLMTCIKYFMICITSTFSTLGLTTLSIGLWGLCSKRSLAGDNIGNLGTDPMLALLLGGLMVCGLFFPGCLGFIRENTYLLKAFFVGMIGLLVTQSLAAILIVYFQKEIQESLKSTVLVLMSRYQDDADLKFILDEIQLAMKCCGVESYQDWSVNLYFNCTSPGVNACGVPYSCCIDPLQDGMVPNSQCGSGVLGMGDVAASSLIYLRGCISLLFLWVDSKIFAIMAVYFLVIMMELFFLACTQRMLGEIKVIRALY